jgi:hypothetical protein
MLEELRSRVDLVTILVIPDNPLQPTPPYSVQLHERGKPYFDAETLAEAVSLAYAHVISAGNG